LNDTKTFSGYINHMLKYKNEKYEIGGYGEYRAVYSRSKVVDGKTPGEEPDGFMPGSISGANPTRP
jgi:hypothetical protein